MINPLSKEQFMKNLKASEELEGYSENAIERFWNWMYSDLDDHVQVCAFPVPTDEVDRSDLGGGKWTHVDNKEDFINFAKLHSNLWRYHVYSGVNTINTIPEEGRGDYNNVDRVNHLTFDIETKRDPYTGASHTEVWWGYKYAQAQTRYMVEEYDAWPLFVMSENGIHLHFKADFPVNEELMDGGQHKYSEKLTHEAKNNKYVDIVKKKSPKEVEFDQDDVSDPSRVMKVAGTMGIKSDEGRMCGIIHEPDKNQAGVIESDDVDISDFDFSEVSSSNTYNRTKESVELDVDTETSSELSEEVQEKIEKLSRNDPVFKQYWLGRVGNESDGGYKTRSEAEFAFILKLLGSGFTKEEIVDIMWASGMSKWNQSERNYRERTLANAVDEFDGKVKLDSSNGSYSFSRA